MQWGTRYRELHSIVWAECFRVIKDGGTLILNFKNHIRAGTEIDAFGWHISKLINTGFKPRQIKQIQVTGNRFGKHNHLRIPFEYIAVLQK